MNCFYHPTRPAVAQCPDCGKGLCHSCASKYRIPICTECNNARGKSELKTYLMPIIVCSFLFVVGCAIGGNSSGNPLFIGYIFTCIYGGWSIVNMFFTNIFISLDLRSIIFYFGLKIILSIIIGVFTTPVFLGSCIYKLIRLSFK